jgi:hypothetical protein
MLSTYINKEEVVKRLIKLRCKLADQKAQEIQLRNFVSLSSASEGPRSLERFIYSLFPPRSRWCHLGKARQNLDSVQRNKKKLFYTYIKAKRNTCKDEWYLNLCRESDKIIEMALHPVHGIPAPHVHVLEKKREKKTIFCRPVCTFDFELRIVLSLYNKILTDLFDDLFYPCSYAFRKSKPGDLTFQHLKAVRDIQKYRKNHLGRMLFVAECDMQKFYDTIDHGVIKARFNMLFNQVRKRTALTINERRCIKSWFYSYVDCFNFDENVNIYNKKEEHPIWKSIKNRHGYKCQIAWVKELLQFKKSDKRRLMRGVPQGGPISGFIANVVIHYVDRVVEKEIQGKDIQYFRFCDDMILIGCKKSEVEQVLGVYNSAIKRAKLFPHPSKSMNYTHAKDFWEGKTRGPYKWGDHGKDVYPWITFVGFDINWEGNIRIRMKSFEKHIKKQHDTVWSLLNQYNNHSPKFNRKTVLSSIKSRLVAMSVGRVTMWNYKENANMHSWMAAFSILDKNPWSEKQLKLLDRHRNKEIHRAKKFLERLSCPNETMKGDHKRKGQFFLGYPFSYYGQGFKKW